MTSVYDGTAGAESARTADLKLGSPGYRSIHRSILAGLLGNIATRTDEGDYHAAHDRRVEIFPGSALFEKRETGRRSAGGRATEGARPAKRVARWLMAAEIVETGRVYARTCARIDPQWVLELGTHLLRVAHSEPFWNAEAGRVLVKERRRLYNLELETRSASYGKINPVHATEIFIREGLVGDTITWPFEFLAHNRAVREQTETLLTRTRSAGYMNLDEALYGFYARELLPHAEGAGRPAEPFQPVASVPELIDLVRHRQATRPNFLHLGENDLRPPVETEHAAGDFPAALPVDNRVLPLAYTYQPGKEEDGVTVRVSLAEAAVLTPAALDWAVPGHLTAKVELMLKALPKEQRRDLIPLAETARILAGQLALPGARTPQPTLAEALTELLSPRLGVRIDPALWGERLLPDHLRVRVEVVDHDGKVVGASRDLREIQAQLHGRQREVSQHAATTDSSAWRAARAKWEGEPAHDWRFGDLPTQVIVTEHHGVPVWAYPGLKAMPAGVAVRLFAAPEEAEATTRAGLRRLLESQLRHDLGWLEKDLKALRVIGTLAVTLVAREDLERDAYATIARWVCDPDRVLGRAGRPGPSAQAAPEAPPGIGAPGSLTASGYAAALEAARRDLRGVVPKLADWLKEIFTLRLAAETHLQPYPGMTEDLAALLPPDFLRRTPFPRVQHLARYLRGMLARADRWRRDQAKDAGRARELAPFVAAVRERTRGTNSAGRTSSQEPRMADAPDDFRWLVEEFRVSLFAQELGTAEPVSAVRLERALQALDDGRAAEPAAAPPGEGKTAPSSPGRQDEGARVKPSTDGARKGPPLKSLGALDQLFRK
jgi:ATP-dependent helicase HrpA